MTIEEIESKAKDYADRAWSTSGVEFNEDHNTFENIVIGAFMAGAMSERSELLRWRDPNEELPEEGEDVLIEMSTGECVVGFYIENLNWRGPDGIIDNYVSGWRPIHKL